MYVSSFVQNEERHLLKLQVRVYNLSLFTYMLTGRAPHVHQHIQFHCYVLVFALYTLFYVYMCERLCILNLVA